MVLGLKDLVIHTSSSPSTPLPNYSPEGNGSMLSYSSLQMPFIRYGGSSAHHHRHPCQITRQTSSTPWILYEEWYTTFPCHEDTNSESRWMLLFQRCHFLFESLLVLHITLINGLPEYTTSNVRYFAGCVLMCIHTRSVEYAYMYNVCTT